MLFDVPILHFFPPIIENPSPPLGPKGGYSEKYKPWGVTVLILVKYGIES